jgi:hypothetical protein
VTYDERRARRQQIVELGRQGVPQKEIAARFGVHVSRVSQALVEAGIRKYAQRHSWKLDREEESPTGREMDVYPSGQPRCPTCHLHYPDAGPSAHVCLQGDRHARSGLASGGDEL